MTIYYLVLYLVLAGLVAHVLLFRKLLIFLKKLFISRVEKSKEKPSRCTPKTFNISCEEPPASAGTEQLPFEMSQPFDEEQFAEFFRHAMQQFYSSEKSPDFPKPTSGSASEGC